MKVDKRGYLYLGKKFSGQEFSLVTENQGFVLRLERVVKIPAQNAWFFDPEWQEGEMKAQKDIDEGKTQKVEDVRGYLSKIRKRKSSQ